MDSKAHRLYEREEPDLVGIEQELVEAVSKEKPWQLLEELSELRRISPSKDEKRAADRISARFESYGVPYERYDPSLRLSIPESAAIRTQNPKRTIANGSETDFEEKPPEIKSFAFSNSETVRGRAIYRDVQPGESIKKRVEQASLDGDLTGTIVIVDSITAGHDAIEFIREIDAANADGLVLIHPNEAEPHSLTAAPVWGGIPDRNSSVAMPDMVVTSVSRRVGDRLISMLRDASDPVELELMAELETGWFPCPVVVGNIPAESNPTGDFVLLHGHLDSWYYGVTDNATGNAGMVECARILNQYRNHLERDLRIAFWPAHEGGRYGGSTWFVDEFGLELEKHCTAHVVFDSPGAKDATEFNYTYWMPEAAPLCRGAIGDITGKDSEGKQTPRAGDYSFYNLGVTGLMALSSGIPRSVRAERGYHYVGGSGGNADAWHLTTDTLEKADPDVLCRDIEVYILILFRLLEPAIPPLDYRDTVAHHGEIIDEYDEVADEHLDLDPVREELTALGEAVDELYAAIESENIDPTTATAALKELSRRLVRVYFTRRGRFEQEPALQISPYPSLAPVTKLAEKRENEFRFERVRLKRSINAVRYELLAAQSAVETALEGQSDPRTI